MDAMKVVILGATKGMGRAVARQLAARGDELFLLGRDEAQLQRCAEDLKVRDPKARSVDFAICDLERPDDFAAALDAADKALDNFDTLIVTAGLFGTQEQLEADSTLLARMLTVNFTNTVLLCELARTRMLARGGGRLCVFSSVAGDRGRKPVVLYGASKAGLSAYLEGLDLRYRAAGLHTLCVKPGFVRTTMTAGLKEPPFAADPKPVAAQVVRALDAGKAVTYAPSIWGLIMAIIRTLPRFVMRRVSF